MSLQRLNARVCPVCGADATTITKAVDGFRVICNRDFNGCGAESAGAATEALALSHWNADPGAWDQWSEADLINLPVSV